jgi:hypothetical protein
MPLTTQQIEVLAQFDGWVPEHEGSVIFKRKSKVIDEDDWDEFEYLIYPDAQYYFTSPGVLIEMRLKLYEMAYHITEIELKYNSLVEIGELGDLILSREYTAAAIKTSELIQKLEA